MVRLTLCVYKHTVYWFPPGIQHRGDAERRGWGFDGNTSDSAAFAGLLRQVADEKKTCPVPLTCHIGHIRIILNVFKRQFIPLAGKDAKKRFLAGVL